MTVGKAKTLSCVISETDAQEFVASTTKSHSDHCLLFLLLSRWHPMCVTVQWLMHIRPSAEVSTSDPP
jgi:hypothetical protein